MAGYPQYFNPYLPVGYQQGAGFQQFQQPVPQYPAYSGQGQQTQTMTPPTVHAEIIQVKSVEEAERFPVNAGTSQLFQLADDTAFVMKSTFANGESAVDIYAKQPKKPAQPPFDPTLYVTREELEKRLEGLTRGRKRQEKPEQQMEIQQDG